jgi:hypothetical protein
MTIDEDKFHVYMLPSMISVEINVGIAMNAKGGYCWIMLSLMKKDLCQRIDVDVKGLIVDVKGLMSKD